MLAPVTKQALLQRQDRDPAPMGTLDRQLRAKEESISGVGLGRANPSFERKLAHTPLLPSKRSRYLYDAKFYLSKSGWVPNNTRL